jgi:hypothetical protein
MNTFIGEGGDRIRFEYSEGSYTHIERGFSCVSVHEDCDAFLQWLIYAGDIEGSEAFEAGDKKITVDRHSLTNFTISEGGTSININSDEIDEIASYLF